MSKSPVMSIGAVAKAVGLSEGTLRNWERRYGYPKPQRTDGGHRVYGQEVVDFLNLVARAIRLGHRPAQLLGMTKEQLEALLPAPGPVLPIRGHSGAAGMDDLLRYTKSFDSDGLFRWFRSEVASAGLKRFVHSRAGELLTHLGQWWAASQIEIEHEHFAAEVLRDYLSSEWRTLNADAQGPAVVCATPVGETHALGLHLVACCLVLAGYRVIFLGPDSPPSAVAAASTEVNAAAACISMSAFSAREDNELTVKQLHEMLPRGTEIWLGGEGADGLPASHTFRSLETFSAFLSDHLPQLRARQGEASQG